MRGARKIVERAGDVRDPPAVVADVGERQRDDGEREPEAAREREHRRGVGARAVGRFFDDRDAGDDERRVDERALEHLRAGEDYERRRDRRDRARDGRPDDAEEDRAPPPAPVGERGREEGEDRADPRDRERTLESVASDASNESPIGSGELTEERARERRRPRPPRRPTRAASTARG